MAAKKEKHVELRQGWKLNENGGWGDIRVRNTREFPTKREISKSTVMLSQSPRAQKRALK